MRILTPAPRDLWLDAARRCPTATFFHTPLWHELAQAARPEGRDATVAVELPGGSPAILPLFELGRQVKRMFAEMESTFAGCYGGIVVGPDLSEDERQRALGAALGSLRIARLAITGNPVEREPSLPGARRIEDATHILALDRSEPPETSYSESHRRSIRKAVRSGVSVARAESLAHYREYYDVYEDSLRRWADRATSRYPFSMFERGWRMAQEHPENLALWLARHEGRIAAGAWIFTWNKHAVYWHGATREASFPARPGHLLHAEIIRDARERGLSWYDFNPSGGHAGVARFKSGFGAQITPVPRWEITGRLFLAARALSRAIRG